MVKPPGRILVVAMLLAAGCAAGPTATPAPPGAAKPALPGAPGKADDFLIVDCLIPPVVRKLGTMVYMLPRRPIKTSARDCEIRGGEYVAYDRADYKTALNVWRDQAEKQKDPAAQTYVGEIYEKGLGVPPDYAAAAVWYRRAAEAGYARAAINLGYLYENGLGVPRDPVQAINWYRKGAGGGAGTLQLVYPDQPVSPAGPKAPRIVILHPDLILPVETRDIQVRPVTVHTEPPEEITLVGSVTADHPLKSVTVNEREQTLDARGIFRTPLPLRQPEVRVQVAAADASGLTSRLDFVVLNRVRGRTSPRQDVSPRPDGTFGKYHALVIGNDTYRSLRPLRTAVNDAVEIARVLEEQYGFTVTLRLNATRYDTLSALYEVGQRLSENDSLLVYYAGHGELDRVNQRGHWLPVDADRENPANWISNISVTDMLNALGARQVLVVADSCYSGAMTRSAITRLDPELSAEARAKVIQAMARQRSRVVLTSGGLEPVVDTTGGRHSPFAQSFLDVLSLNRGVLPTQELFSRLKPRVVTRVQELAFLQVPEYGPIRVAGHEGGDFLFVRKP